MTWIETELRHLLIAEVDIDHAEAAKIDTSRIDRIEDSPSPTRIQLHDRRMIPPGIDLASIETKDRPRSFQL